MPPQILGVNQVSLDAVDHLDEFECAHPIVLTAQTGPASIQAHVYGGLDKVTCVAAQIAGHLAAGADVVDNIALENIADTALDLAERIVEKGMQRKAERDQLAAAKEAGERHGVPVCWGPSDAETT